VGSCSRRLLREAVVEARLPVLDGLALGNLVKHQERTSPAVGIGGDRSEVLLGPVMEFRFSIVVKGLVVVAVWLLGFAAVGAVFIADHRRSARRRR
jgi:hypothetical protein